MTGRSLKISLRLDNGDTIRGCIGDAKRSAQLVGIKQQIEAGPHPVQHSSQMHCTYA